MSVTAQFAQGCNALAQKLGISTLVIVLKEPGTQQPKLVATAGALADPAIRVAVTEQFRLGDTAALEAKCKRLETEIASLGGDTAWTA